MFTIRPDVENRTSRSTFFQTLICLMSFCSVTVPALLIASGCQPSKPVQSPNPDVEAWCVIVTPTATTENKGRSTHSSLTIGDYSQIDADVPTISLLVPVAIRNVSVVSPDHEETLEVWGTTPDILPLYLRTARIPEFEGLKEGRFLTTSEMHKRENVAVLGSNAASRLFPDSTAIGKTIQIHDDQLTIVGVLTNAEKASETQERVYVDVRWLLDRDAQAAKSGSSAKVDAMYYELSQLWLRVENSDPKPTWSLVEQILQKKHPEGRFSASLLPADRVSER
jgi:hypothetical protein